MNIVKNLVKILLLILLGYRRYGHNEMDEPLVTNPVMYHAIHKHPTVRELYGQQLVDEKLIESNEVETLDESVFNDMQEAYDRVKELPQSTVS